METYLPPIWPTVVILALLVSVGGLVWMERDRLDEWRAAFSERFLLGVPWGSIIGIAIVLAVYLFVQDGITNFDRPVFLPFVNWSYLYPTGVILGAFTHASPGHLIGNLVTAVVLAPIAEYIWGHYPPQSSDRRRHHPVVRAFVLFPGALLVVGLVTSAFSMGPVIGFSGVVFGLAGFVVVRFPMVAVIALVARSAVRELGRAILEPVEETTVGTALTAPAWAGVSFHGHALGFLTGAFLGILLLHHRERVMNAVRVWVGLVLVMSGMGIWAIWTSPNQDTFVLYRGLGFALLLLAGLVLTLAVVSSDRPIKWRVTRRHTALLAVGIPLLIIAGIAVPFNVLTVTDYETPEHAIEVDGYEIFYEPETERRLGSMLTSPEEPGNASGVIIVDEDRHIWMEAISSSNLEFAGERTVAIGDVASRTDVTANRTGWSPVGNDTVYRVTLEGDGTTMTSYVAEPRQAEHRVAGHAIAIDAAPDGEFAILVHAPDDEIHRAPVPSTNESVNLGQLTIEREEDRLLAVVEETRVYVAEYESA